MSRRTFQTDASDWHLSGIQATDIDNVFDYVADDLSMIKDKELDAIKKERVRAYLHYLTKGGRDLLLEPLRDLQPKSFKVLDKFSSKFKHGFLWKSIIPAPHLPKNDFIEYPFFEVNGRLILIEIPIWPDKYFGGDERAEVLPAVITNSWLKHGAGWGIGELPMPGTSFRQLIGNHSNWYSIEEALFSYDPDWPKTNMMSSLKERVPNLHFMKPEAKDSETLYQWSSMRCFLDTRPYDLAGKCGDQFFVVDSLTDKVVYHIHNGDVGNLRVLIPEAVGEAMDEYCAHTLMRIEGRFDFLPYSKVL